MLTKVGNLLLLHRLALVGIYHRATRAIYYSHFLLRRPVAQHLVTSEQFGRLGQIFVHRIGTRRICGVVVYRLWRLWRGVVVVALRATEAIPIVHTQALKQRMVHTIKFYLLVAKQNANKLAILHHRAEISRA